MAIAPSCYPQLSDQQLIDTVKRLVDEERQATGALIRSLMELDGRRLYLAEGFPSMFAYCTSVLHLSEHAAYNRIEVARAGRRHPPLLDTLESGAITLTAGRLLAGHLTQENCERVLAAARHRNKRQIEELVATLRPQPDAPSLVRKLPVATRARVDLIALPSQAQAQAGAAAQQSTAPTPSGRGPSATATPAQPAVTPLAPERYKIQFTARQSTHDKLRRAQDLLRHVIPTGDAAEIFDRALTLLIVDLERRRLAAVPNPRPSPPGATGSRHIPADVRRKVWARDEGRCAFIGSLGRCAETGFLELHHVQPFSVGGAATVENIQLRCRPHNAHEASLFFGDASQEADGGTLSPASTGRISPTTFDDRELLPCSEVLPEFG